MWHYENHLKEDYISAIKRVEQIAVELGAEFVCIKKEKFTTACGDNLVVEEREMNVYKYNNEYFWVETYYLSDCPFIVLSFGDTIETIFDDAEPFPYNLSDEELILEVKHSLGIEAYD